MFKFFKLPQLFGYVAFCVWPKVRNWQLFLLEPGAHNIFFVVLIKKRPMWKKSTLGLSKKIVEKT